MVSTVPCLCKGDYGLTCVLAKKVFRSEFLRCAILDFTRLAYQKWPIACCRGLSFAAPWSCRAAAWWRSWSSWSRGSEPSRPDSPCSQLLSQLHPGPAFFHWMFQCCGSGLFFLDPDPDFLPIPDQGGKKGTGYRIPDPDPQHWNVPDSVVDMWIQIRLICLSGSGLGMRIQEQGNWPKSTSISDFLPLWKAKSFFLPSGLPYVLWPITCYL